MSFHIDFVCTGNICRSPMAEAMLHDAAQRAGLSEQLLISSCGLGNWHVGQPADYRTIAELARHGIDGTALRASQLSATDLSADLLVALDEKHQATLLGRGVSAERVRLLRSFDPDSPPHASVPDPYYGGSADFAHTYQLIEAALPGLLDWLRQQL